MYIALALSVLAVIVATTLRVEKITPKVLIFLILGAITSGILLLFGGKVEHHMWNHTFVVDYAQFIFIPAVTVLIASLNLFECKVMEGTNLSWFLWFVLPIIGNFATTWAVVPILYSLRGAISKEYGDDWKQIIVTACVFSMNMLALATLAADPPQAFWAMKRALLGQPLGFFYPLTQYWIYILFTWALYFVMLKRLGAIFGTIKNLLGVRPANMPKFLFGAAIAACLGFTITKLSGYTITAVLGGLTLATMIGTYVLKSKFTDHERHHSWHWLLETFTIFIAFFSVVALAHTGLHGETVGNQTMIAPVIGLTLGADNAAAFAAAYPQFVDLNDQYMVWYNLFPSVTLGSGSPLGNGPQIVLFLVIFVSMGIMTVKEVFYVWFSEALVIIPYLLVWILMGSNLIEMGFEFTNGWKILTGILAMTAAQASMNWQRNFRTKIHIGWDGRHDSRRETREKVVTAD